MNAEPMPTADGPKLITHRLVLRPFHLDDAPALQRLAGCREIADTMISVPHPYSQEDARQWIQRSLEDHSAGRAWHFAICPKPELRLAGAIELRDLDREHSQGELSFWVGVNSWGKGYASEAVMATLEFGFKQAGLNRIHAHYMVRNVVSGRVLEKAGMRREGLLRQRVRKWGVFEDVVLVAILRSEWNPK
jgi:[ribosomal protein S5]-alanine N-acetyltransferase